MGGDFAPSTVVDGALAAARHAGVAVTLVGQTDAMMAELARTPDWRDLDVQLVEAADVIDMAEAPARAMRRKPRSSVQVAAELVAAGHADGVVTAGHTGAAIVAAHATFGMLPGVDRPALAPIIPTRSGMTVLLDAGATVECRASHLLQFGIMGAVYAAVARGASRPRVGLLSIGEEEGKGNELTREAYRLLKAAPLNFVGNVEARELFAGRADVIVCDGFTGNVVLKLCEGMVETVEELLGAELSTTFEHVRKRLDYAEYGGAPLLGVAGLMLVCHGRSSAKAMCSAVVAASRFAAEGMVRQVGARVAQVMRHPA